MNGKLFFAAICLLIGVATACSLSKNPLVRLSGGLLFALMSLAMSALCGFLIYVGVRNHWTSDGPGMLFIMIGIVVIGFVALSGWKITANVIFGRKN